MLNDPDKGGFQLGTDGSKQWNSTIAFTGSAGVSPAMSAEREGRVFHD
jgi:hypothetical protein